MRLRPVSRNMVSAASQGGFGRRTWIIWRHRWGRGGIAMCAMLVLVCVGVGCGHRASQDECEAIFKRSAEIALREKKVFDPEEVKRQVEIARTSEGDTLIKDCLGKRITEDALACSQRADTHQALEACLE